MVDDLADRPILPARLPIRLALSEPFHFPENFGAHGLELIPQRLDRLRQTHRGAPSARVIDVVRSIPQGVRATSPSPGPSGRPALGRRAPARESRRTPRRAPRPPPASRGE